MTAALAFEPSPARRPTAIHEQQARTGRTTATEATGTRAARGSARPAESGGGTSRSGRFSPAEDAFIRSNYQAIGMARTAAALGRSIYSVSRRATKLGVGTHRIWSKTDDHTLVILWGEKSLKRIAHSLNRTEAACHQRMKELGETMVPAGSGSLSAEAARVGFEPETLRRILEWAGIEKLPSMVLKGARRARHYRISRWDSDDVDLAVERWMETEPVSAAGLRLGLTFIQITRILQRSGLAFPARPGNGKHWRVPTETLDRAIEIVGRPKRRNRRRQEP